MNSKNPVDYYTLHRVGPDKFFCSMICFNLWINKYQSFGQMLIEEGILQLTTNG